MRYGLPYTGSKNVIARELVEFLPPAKVFVDLFAGGCAVTHAAALSGKYERFIVNDIREMVVRFFADAVAGKFRDEKRVIDRETFHRMKDSDPIVKWCWSFGNCGVTYLWGPENETLKLAACRMITAEMWQERKRHYQTFIRLCKEQGMPDSKLESLERLERIQSLESLQRIQSLERLERIQSLESLQRIQSRFSFFSLDYSAVSIPPDATVYADPPYRVCKSRGTNDNVYQCSFDFDRFDAWLRQTPFPVYVSEYDMPEDFVCVWKRDRKERMNDKKNSADVTEKLFVHERFADTVHYGELFPEVKEND